ncbi:hypothetical protein C8Q79DRAFT_491131 [Trametes meyenii]|nr:hypothetical protein C8Q79DRAFT_491131 [Trametes meyenii]
MLTTEIRRVIEEELDSGIGDVRLVTKDEFTLTYDLTLAGGLEVTLRMPCFHSTSSVVISELATIQYLSRHTSLPVMKVLAFGDGAEHNDSTSACFVVYEKPAGITLDTIFPKLAAHQQDRIVADLARWILELFGHRFNKIGSLINDAGEVGPISSKPFLVEGRSRFGLNRGPFTTARAYYLACAQRELDACRMLFAQDAPPSYQRDLEDSRLIVERIAGLLCDLTNRCHGLDGDDPAMSPFSLDIHDIGLKDVFVSRENPADIVAITGWQFTTTRPLWSCARLPVWLSPSMSIHNDNARLATVFKAEIARLDGFDSLFLCALELDDARSTLDDLSGYDAFRDGFLLLPALENILATLPGHEDFAGLNALLDPSTLPGRVARINLLTRGSNAMFLAMTPPRSPLMVPVNDEDTEKAMPPDSSVLVT